MPEHLHKELHLEAGDAVEIAIDHQANVMLLTDIGYSNYCSGSGFEYLGGNYTRSPILLVAPHTGHWHVVIDLGGQGGSIRHGIRVIRRQ